MAPASSGRGACSGAAVTRLAMSVEDRTEEAFVRRIPAEHPRPMEVDPPRLGAPRRRLGGAEPPDRGAVAPNSSQAAIPTRRAPSSRRERGPGFLGLADAFSAPYPRGGAENIQLTPRRSRRRGEGGRCRGEDRRNLYIQLSCAQISPPRRAMACAVEPDDGRHRPERGRQELPVRRLWISRGLFEAGCRGGVRRARARRVRPHQIPRMRGTG